MADTTMIPQLRVPPDQPLLDPTVSIETKNVGYVSTIMLLWHKNFVQLCLRRPILCCAKLVVPVLLYWLLQSFDESIRFMWAYLGLVVFMLPLTQWVSALVAEKAGRTKEGLLMMLRPIHSLL